MSILLSLDDLIKENGLTKDDLNKPMKSEHCDSIAIRVGRDWEGLATSIGFANYEVDDIKEENHNKEPKDQRKAFLSKWKKKYGSSATYAKMVQGLEVIENRELTEYLIGLLRKYKSCNQKECTKTDLDVAAKTRKRIQLCNDDCKSQIIPILVLVLGSILLISCTIFDTQTNASITLGTPHVHLDSAVILWSCKFHNSTNCSQPIAHDLPLLYSLFIGRKNDTRKVIEKAIKTNILNINGAPGFGKSTVVLHAGYGLLENCIPVRYINMEELPWKILTTLANESEGKNCKPIYPKKQTAALTPTMASAQVIDFIDSEFTYYNTIESTASYTNELKQWSKKINRTTILILDSVDIILTSSLRATFIDLIGSLIHLSKFHLHIIIVSQEKLQLSEHFNRLTIRQLSQQASLELLNELAPAIANSELNKIAEILQGYPLALKVIGGILNVHGQNIAHELEEELQERPMHILDKVSDHKEKFRVMMDLVFSKLHFKRCGYMISLFPGSFSREAGIKILTEGCLEIYYNQSLLDDYFLGFQHRYKMHRLIREYMKEKVNTTESTLFQMRFCKYYTPFLLNYAKESELNDIDERMLSDEGKNIELFGNMLLFSSHMIFSTEELAALAFLVSKGYVQAETLEGSYKQYFKNLGQIGELVNPAIFGDLISIIVKHFYMKCTCKAEVEYTRFFFIHHPCANIFDCEVITQLLTMYHDSCLTISEQEQHYLSYIRTYICLHKFSFKENILSFLSRYRNVFFGALTYFFVFYFLLPRQGLLLLTFAVLLIQMGVETLVTIFDKVLAIKFEIKLLCCIPSVISAIFFYTYLYYYRFFTFPVNTHLLNHNLQIRRNDCALILILTALFFIILNVTIFDKCSLFQACHYYV